MNMPNRGTAGATLLMLGLVAVPVLAQQQAPTERPPPAAPPATMQTIAPPSDAELKHFVAAAQAVQDIDRQWEPKMQAAQSDQERDSVRQKAESQMESAVQQHGLTVGRYKEIFLALRTDESVRARVQEILRQQQGGGKQEG